MNETLEAALEAFLGFVVNIYSFKTVQPYTSTQIRQANPVLEYVVPERPIFHVLQKLFRIT